MDSYLKVALVIGAAITLAAGLWLASLPYQNFVTAHAEYYAESAVAEFRDNPWAEAVKKCTHVMGR